MIPTDKFNVHQWFQNNKRSLPWREEKTAYSVWVSEIMLQQTRAAVVVPYFLRWMEAFPSIETLAKAPLDRVIKFWEGLGYYQRARNLHEGAKEIATKHLGIFPKTLEELRQIRGIGPYTANAILAFAYGEKCIPIDGNVKRVLARYFFLEEEITSRKMQKTLEHNGLLIEKESSDPLGEALIELGALICTKKPACFACPLQSGCQAFAKKAQETVPRKKKKTVYERLERAVFLIEYKEQLLVKKNSAGVMQDLFEFPYVTWNKDFSLEAFCQDWGLVIKESMRKPSVFHTFTKFRVTLYPWHLLLRKKPPTRSYNFRKKPELRTLPFSSGHKKILEESLL
ncbi:MAG: A/G-specific adenine glycosylase [Chlamydiota bacterium]